MEFIHNIVETFDRYFESVVSHVIIMCNQAMIITPVSFFTSLQCELDVSSITFS